MVSGPRSVDPASVETGERMVPTTGNAWKWKLPVQLIRLERLRIPESSFQGHGNLSSFSTRRLDSNRLNRKINLFLNSLNKKWLIVFELLTFSGRCPHIGWLILWISIEKDCKMREMHEILSIKISTKDSKLVLMKNYGLSLCEDGGWHVQSIFY